MSDCTQDTVTIWYQVRVTANSKVFGPVKTMDAATELLITIAATGVAEAKIETTTTGPALITGA